MTVGGAVAQLIGLVAIPFITRVYSPEEYGRFGVYATYLGWLVLLSNIGLMQPLIIVRKRYQENAIVRILSKINSIIIISATLWILYLVAAQQSIDKIVEYILFFGAVLFGIRGNINQQLMIKGEEFVKLNAVLCLAAFLSATSKIVIGGYCPTALVLLVANTFFVFLLMECFSGRKNQRATRARKGELRATIRKHKNFLLYTYPQTILNAATSGGIIIVASLFVSNAQVGFLSMANLLATAPSSILLHALQSVVLAEISKIGYSTANLRLQIMRITWILLALMVLVSVSFRLLSDQVVSWILGDEWSDTTIFLSFLFVPIVAQIVVRPLVVCVPILKMQKELLAYELISGSVRFLVFAMSLVAGDSLVNSVKSLAIVSVLCYSVLGLLIYSRLTNATKTS